MVSLVHVHPISAFLLSARPFAAEPVCAPWRRTPARALLLLALCWPVRAVAAETAPVAAELVGRLAQLEPLLDRYPPRIDTDLQRRQVLTLYRGLKSDLDRLMQRTPADVELLYLRGRLQRYGHNLDVSESWGGATRDLRTALTLDPWHVPALLELGTLWVHSWPALAPNAEALFRTAQCRHGSEPLETAQRGLFFSLYFQGRLTEALSQVEWLHQHWPASDEYRQLLDTTRQSALLPSPVPPRRPDATLLALCPAH